MSEDDLNAYKWSLSQPGALTATLNYYREMFVAVSTRISIERHVRSLGCHVCVHACIAQSTKYRPITAPTLVVWGDADAALGTDLLQGMSPRFVADVTTRIIPGASHWVQNDAASDVNAAMDAFLREKGV